MKTELQMKLAKLAPAVSIRTIWTPDPDLYDIRQECCGMDDEDPENWQAWQSEIRATAVVDGEEDSVSDYLGCTWERAGDVPEESNPTISGYEPQMTREALSQLLPLCQSCEILTAQIEAALAYF